MLPRRPACCRALQHPNQVLAASESIWISDALLLSTFQRFLTVSKGTRRHGSFVPGPLECRRRMGKRRIAYRADAASPMFGMGEPWAWMGNIKDLSWRWQAPTSAITRAEKKDILTTLPRWLASWPFPPDIPIPAELESGAVGLPEDATFGREKLLAFQHELSRADADKIQICAQFNHYIKQCITIGSVDEHLLYEALSMVTDEIHLAFSDASTMAIRQLAFYQAVWKGLSSCKIIPLDTVQAKTMDHLLGLISTVPVSFKTRVLARDVLACVSMSQLEGMNASIEKLVKSWSLSWLATNNKSLGGNYKNLILDAKAAVHTSELALQDSKALLQSWKSHDILYDAESAQKTLESLRNGILLGIKSIKSCESSMHPVKLSVIDLAHGLRRVAPSSLDSIIKSCTKDIIQLYQQKQGQTPREITNIRISMLSLVSQLPNASQGLFVETWRTLETQGWHVPEDLGSDLILSHMVSQGYIKDPARLRNIFEAAPDGPTMKEYGFLLISLYKQSKDWSGPRHLTGLLGELNKHFSIHKAFTRAGEIRLKLPIDLIRTTLNSVAIANPRIAYNIYKLCVPMMHKSKDLNVFLCPDFIISMIHDDLIAPEKIWEILMIPNYESRQIKRISFPYRRLKQRLSRAEIALITEMAGAFSISQARPQRVAFRNVSQCRKYLRLHGVRDSAELSRAISYSSIAREIMRKNWIGRDRAKWALDVVEHGEGEKVKNTVEAAVELWWKKMEHLSVRRRHLRI